MNHVKLKTENMPNTSSSTGDSTDGRSLNILLDCPRFTPTSSGMKDMDVDALDTKDMLKEILCALNGEQGGDPHALKGGKGLGKGDWGKGKGNSTLQFGQMGQEQRQRQ